MIEKKSKELIRVALLSGTSPDLSLMGGLRNIIAWQYFSCRFIVCEVCSWQAGEQVLCSSDKEQNNFYIFVVCLLLPTICQVFYSYLRWHIFMMIFHAANLKSIQKLLLQDKFATRYNFQLALCEETLSSPAKMENILFHCEFYLLNSFRTAVEWGRGTYLTLTWK